MLEQRYIRRAARLLIDQSNGRSHCYGLFQHLWNPILAAFKVLEVISPNWKVEWFHRLHKRIVLLLWLQWALC